MRERLGPDSATTSELAKSIERVLADEGPWQELGPFQDEWGPWIGESPFGRSAPNNPDLTQRLRDDLSRLGMAELETTMLGWIRVKPTRALRDAADELPLRSTGWFDALERYHTAWDAPLVYDDKDAERAARQERRRSRKAMLAAAERSGFAWDGYERRFVASWRRRVSAALIPTFLLGSVGGAAAASVAAVLAENGSERASYLAVAAALLSVIVTIVVSRG